MTGIEFLKMGMRLLFFFWDISPLISFEVGIKKKKIAE